MKALAYVMPTDTTDPGSEPFPEQPWVHLTEPHEVDTWINQCNQDLQAVDSKQARGWAVCFSLALGGNIIMHSTDDALVLGLSDEAEWVAPVITAATTVAPPRAQHWVLPADKLTQLLLGLSSLISTTRLVPHRSHKLSRF